jgi:hypothetical protein
MTASKRIAGGQGAEDQDRLPVAAADRQTDDRAARRVNRAQERRETALRKERLRLLENEIEQHEARKAEMEVSFGTETEPEAYEAYAGLLEDLERLYQAYLGLAGEEPARPDRSRLTGQAITSSGRCRAVEHPDGLGAEIRRP